MRDGGRQKSREELEKKRFRIRVTCISSVSPRFMNIGKSIVFVVQEGTKQESEVWELADITPIWRKEGVTATIIEEERQNHT